MQPVATIVDSTAINDGLNKYYGTGKKSNWEVQGYCGCFKRLLRKRASSVFFLRSPNV